MNDIQIGLKNSIAYLELEYWLNVLNVHGMETLPPQVETLRDVLKSIVNHETSPRSLSLTDLFYYSQEVTNPVLKNYIENIIQVKNEITDENISDHKRVLNSQLIYACHFGRDVYSLNLKSATTSIKLRSLKSGFFNQEIKLNASGQFEVTKKYQFSKKIIFKKTQILGGPKECAEYISH